MGTMHRWRFGRLFWDIGEGAVNAPPPVAPIPDLEPDRQREWVWWLDGCSPESSKGVLAFSDVNKANESERGLFGERFQENMALFHNEVDRETNCAARMARDALPVPKEERI